MGNGWPTDFGTPASHVWTRPASLVDSAGRWNLLLATAICEQWFMAGQASKIVSPGVNSEV